MRSRSTAGGVDGSALAKHCEAFQKALYREETVKSGSRHSALRSLSQGVATAGSLCVYELRCGCSFVAVVAATARVPSATSHAMS